MIFKSVSAQHVVWGEAMNLHRSYDKFHHYDFREADGSFIVGITTDRKFIAYENDSNLRILRTWEYRWERGVGEVIIGVKRQTDSLMILVEESTAFGRLSIKEVYIQMDFSYSSKRLADFEFRISEVPNLRLQKSHDHWYVWYTVENNRLSQNQEIHCHVFNEDWTRKRSQILELPYRQREIDVLDLDIEGPDQYLVYCKLYTVNQQEKRGGQPNANYSLLQIDKGVDSPNINRIQLTSDTLFYTNLRFKRKGNRVYYYGTFSKRNEDLTGFFAGRVYLDDTGTVVRKEYVIPDSLLEGDHSELKTEIPFSKLRDFILVEYYDQSGSLTFILEERYTRATGTSGGHVLYEYYYRDLIVARVGQDGIEWVRAIDKYQKTFNDKGRFSSFTTLHQHDTLSILFNEQYFGSGKRKTKFTNPDKFTLVQVSIDPAGAVEKKTVTDHRRLRHPLTISKMKDVGNGRYLCYGQQNKTVQACMIRWR